MIFCGSTLPSCSIATAALSVSSYHVRACYRFWHEPHQRPIMCERDRKGQDARVLPICNELQLPLWYNYPCLVVEHASLTSAFATLPARIPDCDADFRLEVQQLTSISSLTLPARYISCPVFFPPCEPACTRRKSSGRRWTSTRTTRTCTLSPSR